METLEYNGEILEYLVIRKNIKNLYIQIKDKKIIVKVPIKMRDKDMKKFINIKSKWIYTNFKKEMLKKTEEEINKKDIQRLQNIVKINVEKYSKILNVQVNKITIKNIKYAWGSCSNKKNITINIKLANKSEKTIEYVILHEMCHLKEMNHSKKFWNLVEKNMSEYKEYKAILREYN